MATRTVSPAWTTSTRAMRTNMTQITSTTHEHRHAQDAQLVSKHLERAVSWHLLMLCHLHLMVQGVLESHFICTTIHERFSLTSLSSLSILTWSSPSSSTSPFSCTPSNTLSSTTWSPCNTTCAPPRTRGVTTPTTSTPPSQVVSPTTWSSTSSAISRVVFFKLLVIGPGHRRHYARQAAHRSTPRTCRFLQSRRRVSQSVVVCCSMDQGNLMEIDQGNLMSVTARKHRVGFYLRSKDRQFLRNLEGVFVSQSSLSVASDRTGKPVEESNVDQSIGCGVTSNTYSTHQVFCKHPSQKVGQ